MLVKAWLAKLGWSRAPLDFGWITSDWAVGAAPPVDALPALVRAGISSVLDLRAEATLQHESYSRLGLDFLHLKVRDGWAPSPEQLQEGVRWVLDQVATNHKVLICCRAGSGRSVTMGFAILLSQGYSLQQAFSIIARHRLALLSESQADLIRTYAQGLISPADG